jgi:hypothetical protein
MQFTAEAAPMVSQKLLKLQIPSLVFAPSVPAEAVQINS